MGWGFISKKVEKEIGFWRRKIDKIDVKIIKLLNRRARCADEIGKIKQKYGIPIYSPEREKQVIKNVLKHNYGPLSDMAVRRLYERIIDESRRLERESAERREIQNSEQMKETTLSKADVIKHISILFLLTFTYILVREIFVPELPPTRVEIVKISKAYTYKQVGDTLYSKGLIRSKFLFNVIGRFLGLDKEVKAGMYLLSNSQSLAQILSEIVSPSLYLYEAVTIPEGLMARQIAGLLKRKLEIDSLKFMKLVNDPEFARSLGIEANSLEGYLMPDTYYFVWGTSSAERVIRALVGEFRKFYTDSLKEREKELGMTTHQIVTLASIIEGEAKFDSEKPRIAGVYYNRLKRGMLLEADPTIQYIIPDGPRRLLYKDLRIKSPYNTYIYKGLPPGPVNNPGRASILAALYPEKHDFLYFVSDGKGRHIFSKTYREHMKAVKRYRKILARRR
jgi:UPF0755 protein